MEYDVVRTLKALGHELRVIGVHDDLTPIRTTMDDFKPTITFNLMEAFDDVVVFDQNVVSYLELLKVPYTGCNPRGLTLSRDKALAKKLMAYHRIPVPDFLVVPLGRKPKLPKRLQFPLIVKSLTYESSTGISQASVVDNDEQLAQARAVHPRHDHDAGHRRAVHRRPRALRRRAGQRPAAGVTGVGDVVLEDAGEQLAHRDRAREVERQVPEEARHRHRGSRADRRRWPPRCSTWPSASIARSICRGYARIDLRMKADGQLFVIEANPNPQLAQGEDFAESAQRAGVSYAKLIERIIGLGLQWQPSRMA